MTRKQPASSVTARTQPTYEHRTPGRAPAEPTVSARPAATYEKRGESTSARPKVALAEHKAPTYTARAPKRKAATPTKRTTRAARAAIGKPVARPIENAAKRVNKKKLALLLPGHNEELIIAITIKSAIQAGQNKRDIFVVDDNSSDKTREIAVSLLGESNVLSVERSGKAGAVLKAIAHFDIENRYTWLHIADADSIFSPDYFKVYKSKLDARKYAVAVGFVQSMRGNWISTYRALTYTYSQHVTRRIQAGLNMISVFPGPITCFRTDILSKLEFTGNSLTEDFDITLQVHRYHLGKIVFIPGAINYTQDPQSFDDFWKQNLRWQRGFWQGVKKYRIGLGKQLIDVSLGFQMLQTIAFFAQILILIPLIIAVTGNWMIIPVAIAADIVLNGFIALAASAVIKRWNLLGAMPYFYFLRWVEISAFVVGFVEIFILGKFKSDIKGWGTEGRRYKLSDEALQDVAV